MPSNLQKQINSPPSGVHITYYRGGDFNQHTAALFLFITNCCIIKAVAIELNGTYKLERN